MGAVLLVLLLALVVLGTTVATTWTISTTSTSEGYGSRTAGHRSGRWEGRPGMLGVGGDQGLFSVRREQRGRVVHLHLGGELDMATSPVLEGWLAGAESNGNTAIVVDLENVTFMDARGLRAFLRAAERASRSGRSFALVKAPPVVRRMLQITRTTLLLGADPPPPTVDAARSVLSQQRR